MSRRSFAEQIDDVKFLRSREANFESFGGSWYPNWKLGRQWLFASHVNPWMGRDVRRHFMRAFEESLECECGC